MTSSNEGRSNNEESKPSPQSVGLGKLAYHFEPPVPFLFDPSMFHIINGLQTGDISLLIKEIENGNLHYVARFMTPEDNKRLIRALRTDSPLSDAEGRQAYSINRQRDAFLLGRICYWKARGLPAWSHTTYETGIHRAAEDYRKNPIPNSIVSAPATIHKELWPKHLKGKSPSGDQFLVGDDFLDDILRSFINGLAEVSPTAQEATNRFLWFGKHFMQRCPMVLMEEKEAGLLSSFLDLKNKECYEYYRLIVDKNHPKDTP